MAHEAYGIRDSQMIGHVHGDTAAFDDTATLALDPVYNHIEEIEVQYESMVYGLVVTYHKLPGTKQILHHLGGAEGERHKASIQFAQDEYIVHISGRHGNVYDHLKIVTNKGQTIDVGGDGGEPFDFQIPPHHTVMAFKGGLGGHVHNLTAVLRPTFDWNPQASHKVGHTHPDTRPWDDVSLLSGAYFTQIATIRAISQGTFVSGIAVTYLVNGRETRAGPMHQGTDTSGEKVVKKLKLKGNEYITKVEGRAGNVIDYLKFTTSAGQVMEIGGEGGVHFDIEIPAGRRVAAFGGGTNGHLHNLFLHFN